MSRRLRTAVRWGYLVPLASLHALRYGLLLRRKRSVASLSETFAVQASPNSRPSAEVVLRAAQIGTSPGPVEAKCLVRSLVSARLLTRFGYPASVVIGVPKDRRTDDRWRAHAWVVGPDVTQAPAGEFEEIARLGT